MTLTPVPNRPMRPDDPQFRGGEPTEYGDVTPSLHIANKYGVPYETVLAIQHSLTFPGGRVPGHTDLLMAMPTGTLVPVTVECTKQHQRFRFLQGANTRK